MGLIHALQGTIARLGGVKMSVARDQGFRAPCSAVVCLTSSVPGRNWSRSQAGQSPYAPEELQRQPDPAGPTENTAWCPEEAR